LKKNSNGLDASTLGKIVLARCLEQPLGAYERSVGRIEASLPFRGASWVKPASIPGAIFDADLATRHSAPATLGRVVRHEGEGRQGFM